MPAETKPESPETVTVLADLFNGMETAANRVNGILTIRFIRGGKAADYAETVEDALESVRWLCGAFNAIRPAVKATEAEPEAADPRE